MQTSEHNLHAAIPVAVRSSSDVTPLERQARPGQEPEGRAGDDLAAVDELRQGHAKRGLTKFCTRAPLIVQSIFAGLAPCTLLSIAPRSALVRSSPVRPFLKRIAKSFCTAAKDAQRPLQAVQPETSRSVHHRV